MMKRLFIKKLIAIVTLCALCMVPISACGGKDNIVNDGKTVNVRGYKGGYGTSWIYAMKEKFEALYAEEGYKINILTPSSDITGSTVVNELKSGNAVTGVDLYFTGSCNLYAVTEQFGTLVEDLTETVWKKNPIGFDGEEENTLIKDKVRPGMLPYVTSETDGKMYGYLWTSSVGGLAVNSKKLAEYGLSLPRTSDELWAVFDKILRGANGVGSSFETGTFPFTYAPSTGYQMYLSSTWLAQYMGTEAFDRLIRLEDENGEEMLEDGYTLYDDPAFEEMFRTMFRVFDQNVSAYGSTTQSVEQAQAKLVKGNAVFMPTGDWMLNEVSKNYPNHLQDITLINVPVLSAVGEKLFGAGTALNLSKADSDKLLSEIVRLADEEKTAEEIKTAIKADANFGYDLSLDAVQEVIDARGIYYEKGVEHNCYISKDSPMKDVAALFLRMLASEDAISLFESETNGSSPFGGKIKTTEDNPYEFVRAASRIANRSVKHEIFNGTFGLRAKLALPIFPKSGDTVAVKIANQLISKYDENGQLVGQESVYDEAAIKFYNEEKGFIQSKWEDYIAQLG